MTDELKKGTRIDLRVNQITKAIEYRIGEGEWIQHGEPYYTYAGAVAAMMNLRESTKHGLNKNVKALFGLID